MPGPVRYTKSGKVKEAAPRKYESGKGWSKLTPAQQAAPSVEPTRRSSRKRQLRKAVSRGDFGRSFESTPTRRVSAPDTREQNREALGPVGDALATVAKALQEPVDLPGTKLDRIGEILSILVAPRGALTKRGELVNQTGKAARFRRMSGQSPGLPVRAKNQREGRDRKPRNGVEDQRRRSLANRPAVRRRAASKVNANRRRYTLGERLYGKRYPRRINSYGKDKMVGRSMLGRFEFK